MFETLDAVFSVKAKFPCIFDQRVFTSETIDFLAKRKCSEKITQYYYICSTYIFVHYVYIILNKIFV